MKNLYYAFILLFLSGCSTETGQQQLIKTLSDQIASTRPSLTAATGSLNLLRELPLFESGESIEIALEKFFGDSKLETKKLGGSAGTGLSGNSVYLAKLSTGTGYVVKVFLANSDDFEKELLALTTYRSLDLKVLDVPRVYKIGRTQISGEDYLFIAEDEAKGDLLLNLLVSLLQTPEKSVEREKKQAELIKVYHLLGKGLAELHTAGSPLTRVMHPVFYEYYWMQGENGVKGYIHREPSQKAAAERVYALFKSLMEGRGAHPYGYTHGDAHAGNYIWDRQKQQLAMIDLTDAARSIGRDRQPIGNPMEDIARIIIALSAWEMWGLTHAEADQLNESFLAGYRQVDPRLNIAGDEFKLFEMVNAYSFFAWYPTREGALPEEDKRRFQSIWNNYDKVIRNIP